MLFWRRKVIYFIMKKAKRAISFVALVVALAFTPLVASAKTRKETEFPLKPEEYSGILRLWHVETFEGGVGSRADFLTRRAIEFGRKGLHVLVSVHTAESAATAISEGERPDLVSFGAGADFVAPLAKSFSLTVNGKRLNEHAYPWARGGYFLFRKAGDTSPIKTLTVSDGGSNIPLGAVYRSRLAYEKLETVKSTDAYLKLVTGRTDALIGTQRDIRRFAVRNFAYDATPLNAYCDLYQYISVTADNETDFKAAVDFARFLLDESVAEKLPSLNLTSAYYAPQTDFPLSLLAEKAETRLAPFVSQSLIDEIKADLADSLTANKNCLPFENACISE